MQPRFFDIDQAGTLDRSYLHPGRSACVDIGGTRIKLGAVDEDRGWELKVAPTPSDWDQLTKMIDDFIGKHEATHWALGMPGPATPDGPPRSSVSVTPLVHPQIDVAEIRGHFSYRGILPPALIVNDTTAVAHGIIASVSETKADYQAVCQISTALGSVVFRDQKMLMDPSGRGRFTDGLSDTIIEIDGKRASYNYFASWHRMQEWLAPEIRGLHYHQLTGLQHPHIDLMLTGLERWLQAIIDSCPGSAEILFAGGGSLALRDQLEVITDKIGVPASWPADAELPGLDGLQLLIDGAR